ncbi:MAG: ROK family protein [Fimbriimonadales bacterium]
MRASFAIAILYHCICGYNLPVVIGVDLGGTNVRAAAVSAAGEIVGPRIENPSHAREGADACLAAVVRTILEAMAGIGAESIGIAIPGHIDAIKGVVHWAPNFGETVEGDFRNWEDVTFTPVLAKQIDLPITIGNDANLAALGEYRFGSGKACANGLVLLTLGTGVGSGIVLSPACLQGGLTRPSMLIGNKGGAAELGHLTIVKDGATCTCGARGHLEAYCGAEGLLKIAAAHGIVCESPLQLFEEAQTGNESAIAAWEVYGGYLGTAIGSAINAFAPEIVAIGGQVANAWRYFLPEATLAAAQTSIPSLFDTVRIVQAEQFEDAGILGAAALALGEL